MKSSETVRIIGRSEMAKNFQEQSGTLGGLKRSYCTNGLKRLVNHFHASKTKETLYDDNE
jgi:hypothetical protein